MSVCRQTLTHEFVEIIPDHLDDGVLYVSTTYATATHRCFCGCGREVVTPLSPTDWKLTFDGETVSLWPSIGNWAFPCRSHYWIKQDRVEWSGDMPDALVEAGRMGDRRAKAVYYNARKGEVRVATQKPEVPAQPFKRGGAEDVEVRRQDSAGILQRFLEYFRSK